MVYHFEWPGLRVIFYGSLFIVLFMFVMLVWPPPMDGYDSCLHHVRDVFSRIDSKDFDCSELKNFADEHNENMRRSSEPCSFYRRKVIRKEDTCFAILAPTDQLSGNSYRLSREKDPPVE